MSSLMTNRKRKHRCGTSVKGDEREGQLDEEMEDEQEGESCSTECSGEMEDVWRTCEDDRV